MSGQTIAHYQILEKLGEGGMGVVYKARDTRLNRFVALKFLPEVTAEREARFVQEARAASALNHPNIVTIYDVGEAEGRHYLAMEYVAGRTLDALIPRKGMRLGEALKIAVQVADALARAHAAGIIHRDLKPSNIMVDEHGLAKVLDFGLAKLAEVPEKPEEATTQTAAGMVVGTAAYMSPEQAEGKPVDARSDIFSFGSLLYEMVSGERPFRGETHMATLAAIINQEPAPLGPEVPYDLRKTIARCLRKDPARRWQNMADLKVALEELKEDSDSGRLAAVTAPPARRRWLGAAAAVAAIVLGVSGWLAWRQFSRPVPPPTAVPLTSFPGNETQPAFSPDGNFVAFVWDGAGQNNQDVYVQQIGSGAPLRLSSHPAAEVMPDFSPDGRQIAFLRAGAGKWDILVAPALGGAERQVGSVAMGFPWLRWTPDGRFLVVTERAAERGPASIFLLSLETGEKRRLTTPPEDSAGDVAGLVAPDGEKLLVYRWTSMGLGDLFLVPLRAGYEPRGEAQRLTSDSARITGMAWMPDSREVVFSSRREGADALWRIQAGSGGAPNRLAVGGDWSSYPAIAPRGNRLVFASTVLDTNIWRLELAPGKAPQQWIASTQADENPAYSPDGRRIAFVSTRSGQRQIWVSDSAGGSLVQITNLGPNSLADPHWSPDGGRIAFVNTEQGRWHSFVVGASGGVPQRVTTAFNEDRFSSWSRDGQWIYVSSQGQVWKVPVGSRGRPVQVTRDGGFRAAESPDGKFLYYTKRPGSPTAGGPRGSLWRVPVGGGEEVELASALPPLGAFQVTERGVFYLLPTGEAERALHFFDFSARTSRVVVTLAAEKLLMRGAGGFSVSPDGRHLLYTQVDQSGSDLMLVENFH